AGHRKTDRDRHPRRVASMDAAVAPPLSAGGDMGRKKVEAAPVILTPQRAARLYKLLILLGEGPQTRQFLLRRLKLDIRGFYRDLESLRALGIEVEPDLGNKYSL